jgi:hypothetical protein
MSTNLFWEVHKPPRSRPLNHALKWAIQREYGKDAVLTERDIPFLKGALAAHASMGSEAEHDCRVLIDAIATHGAIRVWVE